MNTKENDPGPRRGMDLGTTAKAAGLQYCRHDIPGIERHAIGKLFSISSAWATCS